MNTAMSQALEKAREFLECQRAFRLGELLTESSHPKTRELSQMIQADLRAGIRMLQSVDDDIPAALDRIFAQESFGQLVIALREAIQTGHRIFFTGCGATGRLSILLEAAWRRFWRDASERGHSTFSPTPGSRPTRQTTGGKVECPLSLSDLCISVMAGGDFALIKSVEGFEDFPDFGRHQLKEAGVQHDDVVVAITEGGETSFVIGTAWQALEAGASVFFVYNNPTDLLRRHVQRSREVIDEARIRKLDLATGPMAIAGSTRMQATTTELLVIGAAIEMALDRAGCTSGAADRRAMDAAYYARYFSMLLEQVSSPEAVAAISRAVELEEQVYRRHGLVTYVADSLLLDVLTDTTERSPTFMAPPFRKSGDTVSPVSWAFVKNPCLGTEQAWRDMLQREPRGLTWGPDVYRQLNAPAAIQANSPKLDNDEIYRFRIGNEPDPSRTSAPDSALVFIKIGRDLALSNHPSSIIHRQYKRTAAITLGGTPDSLNVDERFHFPCDLPVSPLRLWEHLAIKLILNTLSTATMVRLGRVLGNTMAWMSPSNKKLIDRGTRLVSQTTGCTYERACEVLHESIEEVARRSQTGQEVPSPVALAIERIGRPVATQNPHPTIRTHTSGEQETV